jgi:hypothetical protein
MLGAGLPCAGRGAVKHAREGTKWKDRSLRILANTRKERLKILGTDLTLCFCPAPSLKKKILFGRSGGESRKIARFFDTCF